MKKLLVLNICFIVLLSYSLMMMHGKPSAQPESHGFGLSETELFQAARIYAQRNRLTSQHLHDITKKVRALVEALRYLSRTDIERHEQVYVMFKLNDFGYSHEQWGYYVKNYRTAENIQRLEDIIPDNDDKIIKQLIPQLQQALERLARQAMVVGKIRLLFPSLVTVDLEKTLNLWCHSQAELRKLNEAESQTLLKQLMPVHDVLEDDRFFWLDYVFKMRQCPPSELADKQRAERLLQRWSDYLTAVSMGQLDVARAFLWGDVSALGRNTDTFPLLSIIAADDLRTEDNVFRSGKAYCLPMRQVRRGGQETVCLRLLYFVESNGDYYLLQDAEHPWASVNGLNAEMKRDMSLLPSLIMNN